MAQFLLYFYLSTEIGKKMYLFTILKVRSSVIHIICENCIKIIRIKLADL